PGPGEGRPPTVLLPGVPAAVPETPQELPGIAAAGQEIPGPAITVHEIPNELRPQALSQPGADAPPLATPRPPPPQAARAPHFAPITGETLKFGTFQVTGPGEIREATDPAITAPISGDALRGVQPAQTPQMGVASVPDPTDSAPIPAPEAARPVAPSAPV